MFAKLLCLLFLLLFSTFLSAQPSDTVVVYEYEYITDTIWVDRHSSPWLTTPIALLEANNQQIVTQLPATISVNPINDATDNKQSEMKKATYISLFLLFLQNLSFAQPELNLIAGANNYWMKPNPYVSSALFLCDHYGIELKVPLSNSKMAISLGFDQHGFSNIDIESTYIIHHANANNANYTIHDYRSLPFLFYYSYLEFDFFAGYEFKMAQFSAENKWNEHALLTGFEKDIGRKFAFSCKVYFAGILNQVPIIPNRIISQTNISFSLKYNLFWKAKINKLNRVQP